MENSFYKSILEIYLSNLSLSNLNNYFIHIKDNLVVVKTQCKQSNKGNQHLKEKLSEDEFKKYDNKKFQLYCFIDSKSSKDCLLGLIEKAINKQTNNNPNNVNC